VYRSLPWFSRMTSQAGKPMALISPLDLTTCRSNACSNQSCRFSLVLMTQTCRCRRLACRHEPCHTGRRCDHPLSFGRGYWIAAASEVAFVLGQAPLRMCPHIVPLPGIKEGVRSTRRYENDWAVIAHSCLTVPQPLQGQALESGTRTKIASSQVRLLLITSLCQLSLSLRLPTPLVIDSLRC
jgi:hypothetical protein